MKVLFVVFANRQTGLGHWYRSIALADYLHSQGDTILVMSDRNPRIFGNHFWLLHQHCHYNTDTLPFDVLAAVDTYRPDWTVIDLPFELPGQFYDDLRGRSLVLNGVGHVVGDKSDLRIVQGLDKLALFSGAKYVILRPSLFQISRPTRPFVDWFVFGGASDQMQLTARFPDWNRVSFSIDEYRWNRGERDDEAFLRVAVQCHRACIAMGMTAWELCALGVPAYVFSVSAGHLKFAKAMDKAGLVKAYPEVGLPAQNNLIDFLRQPFEITGEPPDRYATRRIRDLMIKE